MSADDEINKLNNEINEGFAGLKKPYSESADDSSCDSSRDKKLLDVTGDLVFTCSVCGDNVEPDAIHMHAVDQESFDKIKAERDSLAKQVETYMREIERLHKVIAQELSENDELGAEYAYVLALKEEVEQLKAENAKRLEENDAYYFAQDKKVKDLQSKLITAETQLFSCKAAMTYAHEDHSDQYYLNVLDDIDACLAKIKGDNK